MPKHLTLIVEDESACAQESEAEMAKVMQMHGDFAKSVAEAKASVLGGEARSARHGRRAGSTTSARRSCWRMQTAAGGTRH